MMTFQQRLKKVMAGGNLRVADLARWFERPHATVRCWVEDGREPGGGPQDAAAVHRMLKSLETLVKGNRVFPVPRLAPKERIRYLAAIRRSIGTKEARAR